MCNVEKDIFAILPGPNYILIACTILLTDRKAKKSKEFILMLYCMSIKEKANKQYQWTKTQAAAHSKQEVKEHIPRVFSENVNICLYTFCIGQSI